MSQFRNISLALVIVLVGFSGCAASNKVIPPLNDQSLIYDLPYDLVYLKTIEAAENVQGWEMEETEKEKGVIRISNSNTLEFSDADKREITLIVKRLSRGKTSVQIAPESQRVIGGDVVLQRISDFVSREI